MKLFLMNTTSGLIPMYDDDYEEKKKLKLGMPHLASITQIRNYKFHKKYFSLINLAWEYQNEDRQKFFKNKKKIFRKTVQIAAGHCDFYWSIKRKEWVEESKSISFEDMDELEFRVLYDDVKTVLFSTFLTHIDEEEFNKNLINF